MAKKRVALGALIALAAAATAAHASGGGKLPLGPATQMKRPTFKAYYDGHKDTYLVTDVSNKSQAKAMHITYAPALKTSKHLPLQYFVKGKAAKGQLSVFGSEPPDPTYNPLWDEVFVTWKAGETPVVLKSDTQIGKMVKKHKLTMRNTHIVLNAPIIKVK